MAATGAAEYMDAQQLLEKAGKLFEAQFKQKAQYAAAGPGRVNLIGEHTDYNDGFVFPMVSLSNLSCSQP